MNEWMDTMGYCLLQVGSLQLSLKEREASYNYELERLRIEIKSLTNINEELAKTKENKVQTTTTTIR